MSANFHQATARR